MGFVQGQGFDQRRVLAVDAEDLLRSAPVPVHGGRQDDELRAQLERVRGGHGRAHAVGSRLVTAGGDHTALRRRPAHGQGDAAQAGIVAHFDGGVETIAIAMDDLARHG